MTGGENGTLLSQALKGGGLSELLGSEDLLVEALRDLLRDEIKRKMREALDANPELKEELKDAVRLYFEAKVREGYATLKFAKAGAKLGVELMPPELRAQLGREIGAFLEREVAALIDKSV